MRIRISIGCLTPLVRVPCGEIDAGTVLGILNPKAYAKGERLYQPLGGGAVLTELGQELLSEKFGASDFEPNNEGGIDARFMVEESEAESVLDFFKKRDTRYFSADPFEELVQELSGSEFPKNQFFDAIPPILTRDEVMEFGTFYRSAVLQPAGGANSSPRAGTFPTRRLFHIYDLELPDREVIEKMLDSRALRVIDDEELATIEGGRMKGRTKQGDAIADNFILSSERPWPMIRYSRPRMIPGHIDAYGI